MCRGLYVNVRTWDCGSGNEQIENMFVNKHVPVCLCTCGCEKAHALRKRPWVHMTVEEKSKVQVPVKRKEIDLCDCACHRFQLFIWRLVM